MGQSKFARMVAAGAGHNQGARHQRRAEEAEARKAAEGKSIPAIKKLIRRNKQRRK